MMRPVLSLMLILLGSVAGTAQHQHSTPAAKQAATLDAGMGSHHHPVSTRNPEAQKFFDQGLKYVYAFNHDEAVRSFERAAELDPNLAMAHWGKALALGPNINLDVDPKREQAAHDAVQKARSLARNAPEHERAYIEALAKRYSNDPRADLKKLAVDYKKAMGELLERYPDDLDLATLYAEAAMNLRPWKLWKKDGTPEEGTEEIVQVLESVLRRDPDHIGANHYYIHAVEASRYPERALPSAQRLTTLVPAAGHLVHMPAHIFMRTGDYRQATESNAKAAAVDRDYIARRGLQGFYPMMYYSHNLHFLASAAAMEGRLSDAQSAADQLASHAGPLVKDMSMLHGATQWPILILVRFGRWNDVLATPAPTLGPQAAALWRFARGLAFAETGKLENAEREQKNFQSAKSSIPREDSFMLNRAADIFAIAEAVLAGKIAETRGDHAQAIELLRKAALLEDKLAYDEPPNWPNPVREVLGGLLLRRGRYAEAETVFREELNRNPRSGRALFGLMKALGRQQKEVAANQVRVEFEKSWARADVPLRVEDL